MPTAHAGYNNIFVHVDTLSPTKLSITRLSTSWSVVIALARFEVLFYRRRGQDGVGVYTSGRFKKSSLTNGKFCVVHVHKGWGFELRIARTSVLVA